VFIAVDKESTMSFDILESLNSALGGPLARQVSAALGESEDTTRSAVHSVAPTLLAGLMQKVSSPAGASDLLRMVKDDRMEQGLNLGNLLGSQGGFDSLRTMGESLLGGIFGNRSGALGNAISQVTGARPASTMSLLSMGLPLMLGFLRKQAPDNTLDTPGLTSLLASQRGALERSGLDNRITSALGFGNLSSLLNSLPGVNAFAPKAATASVRRDADRKTGGWLPWAIAAGVGALGLLFFLNRNERPDAGTVAVAPVTDDTTRVYFDSGQASIDQEDRIKIASVAGSVRDQGREVAITGYTDRTGDRDQNLEVAKSRAVAVREALVAEGVSESKITMAAPAEVTGAGTDAEARRVDIEVR
jgi:outer membrane protein OmpA-like peptidoglycan-associated protein